MEGRADIGRTASPMGARTLSMPEDVHPEQLPEARREQLMLSGALQSLENTADELRQRLVDYMRDDEPASEKLAEVVLPVRTPYGRALRQSYEQVGTIESRLQSVLRLLEL